jgi:uncharacterized BrkB/YihY/UPF0761 family membrane protein
MQQFKISQANLAKMRKKMLIRLVPLPLIAVAIAIVTSTINSKSADVDLTFIVLPALLPLLFFVFSIYRIVRRQRQLFESYTLTFETNLVTREQINTPTISIYYNDIKEVNKNKNGTFTIKSKNPQDVINVPVQIENYNELEQLLNDIILITENREPLLKKLAAFTPLIILGLLITVNVVQNKIAVAVCGTAFVALSSWCVYYLVTNKNIDSKNKRKLLLSLIGLSVLVIVVMVLKLNL